MLFPNRSLKKVVVLFVGFALAALVSSCSNPSESADPTSNSSQLRLRNEAPMSDTVTVTNKCVSETISVNVNLSSGGTNTVTAAPQTVVPMIMNGAPVSVSVNSVNIPANVETPVVMQDGYTKYVKWDGGNVIVVTDTIYMN